MTALILELSLRVQLKSYLKSQVEYLIDAKVMLLFKLVVRLQKELGIKVTYLRLFRAKSATFYKH